MIHCPLPGLPGAHLEAARVPAIQFDRLEVSYAKGPHVLRGVSLHVPPGQFCVVLGASGAGKSTLLKTVNGLVAASAGRVLVDGSEVTPRTLRWLRPRMAMIHQHFDLVPRATVAANTLTGALAAVPTWRVLMQLYPQRFRDKACELLDEVGLEPQHLQRPVSLLSGGQQQRVGIARAFMLDPVVLLADEPVASLDPRTSRETLKLLKAQCRQRGTTVLCSLHQVDLARSFADRIVVIREGSVAFDGTPAELTDAQVNLLYGMDAARGLRLRSALREPE